jgi:hypothetical protein
MTVTERTDPDRLGLTVDEWVEVRSEAEILATLDANARLDELPFMPQMLELCGRRFRVRKRAHKLCDTATSTGGRRMSNAVFLEDLRCDGRAYGGCEMRCLIVWKEGWLKRVPAPDGISAPQPEAVATPPGGEARCARDGVWAATRAPSGSGDPDDPVYVCQATQMPKATRPLSRWSFGQYVEDYRSGNARVAEILSGLLFVVYDMLAESGLGFGSAMRWAYDRFQWLRGGTPYPSRRGCLPKNGRTPSVTLGLRVGDVVRVKSHAEILRTVDEELKNRGMSFHGEMVPYCGRELRVLQRAGKFINERTGKLMVLKNECLVLDGADCVGRYTNPLFCPRACYPYWREIWLERVGSAGTMPARSPTPPLASSG